MNAFRHTILLSTLFITVLPTAKSKEARVISEAIDAIEMCYHWAGEVGEGDKQRQEQIAQGSERDCPIAKEKAKQAYQKYPNNSELIFYIFELMDIGYFEVSSETKMNMCKTTINFYKNSFARSKHEDDIYKELCPSQAKVIYGK